MTDFTVARLDEAAGFLAERAALFQQAEEPPIFLSPDWIATWLEGAPDESELSVVKGVQDGAPVLLGVVGAPKRRSPPLSGPRTAHLHEFGLPAHDAIYIEYNDFLIAKGAPPDCRARALEAALDGLPGVDELVLRNARPALADAALNVAAARGLGTRILNAQRTHVVDLDTLRRTGADYLSAAGSSLRAQIRRSARLYEARGSLSLRLAQTSEERDKAWRILLRLHEEGWRRRGERGVFANEALRSFHERFMRRAPESAHLMTLYAGEEPIGGLYNLVHGSRVCNYQSGFRYEEDNRLKPGLLAHALAAQSYLEKGYSVYDLLAGDAEYKKRLGREGETLTTMVIDCGAGPRADFRKALRRLRGALRSEETHRT